MLRGAQLLTMAVPLFLTAGARADVTISSAATQNMTCSGGVCAPTAKNALLNFSDLENLLASGNVTVTTTGLGTQAVNISVKSALSWSAQSTLALDSYRSITISRPVAIDGAGGLAFVTNDGGKKGALSFSGKGHVTFANLSSSLTIDHAGYTLVNDIATLASDIASQPNNNFALANPYDAGNDGTYNSSPIITVFGGNFEGLGNKISNLTIVGVDESCVGLFAQIEQGQLRDIGLTNVNVSTTFVSFPFIGALVGCAKGLIRGAYSTGALTGGDDEYIGGLVGYLLYGGTIGASRILNSYSTAAVTAGQVSFVGGLVGGNDGTIEDSYAIGSVSGRDGAYCGGLVGYDDGRIEQSFATGSATVGNSITGNYPPASAGGLVGYDYGADVGALITNSYAKGAVTGGQNVTIGGLVGYSTTNLIITSYSTGAVTGQSGAIIGGLIGYDYQTSTFQYTYWDTDTSGITNLSQGAGNIANDPGITGLTTAQLQSGLPQGFDPKTWTENSSVNGGLPYLIANPSPK